MPSRSPVRRRHLQVVPEPHRLLVSLFPPLSKDEITTAAERVRLYGQTEPIETLHGAVVSGWQEYLACGEAGVVPTYTEIEEPDDLMEYVVRRNIPRHLSKLDRACIAVLAQAEFKAITHARKVDGARSGDLRAGKLRATVARSCFQGDRWTHTAARVVGTTEGAVRRLAQLFTNARDVFDAVRARRIEVLRDARDLAERLPEPEARREALARHEQNPRIPAARLIAAVMRARRPDPPTSKRSGLRGKAWTLYAGPMASEARNIPDASVELVHADIVYGDVDMASEVGHIAARVLVPGGVLALISGNLGCLEVLNAVVAEGLTLITIGSIFLRGGYPVRPGAFCRVDSLPVFFFGRGDKLARPLDHLAFESPDREVTRRAWGKNSAATLDLVRSAVDPGAGVLDPCCGSGTTGEAALRHGCSFVGIDIDPEAIKIASARLAQVERELAQAGHDDGAPGVVKAGRRRKTRTR